MTRAELLRKVRLDLNALAVELVDADLLAAAQNTLAASMACAEVENNLASEGEDETETRAGLEPAQGG